MDITSRWTGGPYYLTPEQRELTRILFERLFEQKRGEKAMTRVEIKQKESNVAGKTIKPGMLVQQLEINLSEETKEFLMEILKPEPIERGHGEWMFRTNLYPSNGITTAGYVCSVCGCDTRELWNYCPICGCAMINRVEQRKDGSMGRYK